MRFKIWATFIGRPDLDISKRKSYRICDKHFPEEMKYATFHNVTNLKKTALPVNKEVQRNADVEEAYSSLEVNVSRPNELVQEPGSLKELAVPGPSRLVQEKSPPRTPVSLHGAEYLDSLTKVRLSPQKKRLYITARKFQRRASYQLRKSLNFQARLKKAEQFSSQASFNKLTETLNENCRKFFLSQISCSKKKMKGRRFSTDDKVMSLALFKQSPSGYRLLSKIFALPSRVTLMKFLNRLPVSPGLNLEIFNGLSRMVNRLDPSNRTCVLLFDEMSLSRNLTYNVHKDCVEGFEDFGDHQTDKIADHVQVFMLRGIVQNWKQPVLYQFVNGAAKGPQIVKAIKEIILAAQNAGFNVVGTICDQG
ncbi:uncharacterized protein LOC123291772 isoform X2 [Chrysoperla carnea]|uniref:uncharacterized protein LOC123291772 isoform X2 n=1 Tax=Chrysoperla carnea TaxID=189513 RepID=UPI001D065403|nr:uncharacterized protein LOC123291772 isoform X2 [Chrysoperla carnea]